MADEQGPFRNRIVGQGIKPADQFLANERNTRRHGQLQRSVIHDLLEQLGWVDVVKVNVRSSELWPEQDRHVETLVDGHERIWQALQANNADVPYIEVDLTPAEEALMLTSFDASGALADLDAVAFEDVLRDVDTGSAAIQEMLAQMAASVELHSLPPSLDDLADQYGDPQERDFWPFIRVQVSPDTMERWTSLMQDAPGEDEAAKVAYILERVDVALFGG